MPVIANEETEDFLEDQNCPNCGKPSPVAERVRGVCPRCKSLLSSVHGKVLGRDNSPKSKVQSPKPAAHWDENSQRIQTTDDVSTAEAVYHGYCHDFAVNLATAMEQAAFWANHFGDGSGDESGAAQALARFKDLLTRGFTQVQIYEKHHGDRVMAERCLWLMLDLHALAGADVYEELVKLLAPRSKQTVNKCMQFLQSQIPELPILQGQRNEVGKNNIAAATKQGWRKQGIK